MYKHIISHGNGVFEHRNPEYGSIEWYLNTKLHRKDLPAIEIEGKYYKSRQWYINGELHRENGPAIERMTFRYNSCSRKSEWYKHGKLHRENGPAVIEESIEKEYKHSNRLITKGWYIDGKLHNENGPAYETSDGKKAWYINGIKITEKEFNIIYLKNKINEELPINNQIKTKKIKL